MQTSAVLSAHSGSAETSSLTVFLCGNCARPAAKGTAGRAPVLPDFQWPFAVHQVPVPCSGRVQPEYILKALEAGADAVCVVACDEDNCHYTEGCRRARRRVEYVQRLLAELGLEKQRVMLQQLPGSARQDLALNEPGRGADDPAAADADLAHRVRAVRDAVLAALAGLPPSPLKTMPGSTDARLQIPAGQPRHPSGEAAEPIQADVEEEENSD